MIVICSRCGTEVEGQRGAGWTSGFYDVSRNVAGRPRSAWAELADPDETSVCDACMHADPRYIAVYGPR